MNDLFKPLPMLAKPLTDRVRITPGTYVVEEKFDGHRMVLRVAQDAQLSAWSRTGIDCMKKIGSALRAQLSILPPGVYDGELIIPGGRCSDVTRIENYDKHIFVLFDMLALGLTPVIAQPLSARRMLLEAAVAELTLTRISLAKQVRVDSRSDIERLATEVWDRSGEGLIIKNVHAQYFPSKRSDAFMKLKEVQIGVATITGFERSSGEVFDRGPCAVTLLRDDNGVEFSMKTRDDAMCRMFEQNPQRQIGRRVVFEYHQFVDSYISPRWDRFEDE